MSSAKTIGCNKKIVPSANSSASLSVPTLKRTAGTADLDSEDPGAVAPSHSNEVVATPVTVAELRSMGRATPSMRAGKGMAASLFSVGKPPRFTGVAAKDNAPYAIMQMVNFGTLSSSTGGIAAFAANFILSDVDQYTSLTAVFDQYRITEVEVWLIPRLAVTTSSSQNPGQIASVVDYDDDTTLSSLNQALDYQNCMIDTGTVGHYRRFKPHAAVAAFSGSFTSYVNVVSPWIDAASPSVRHYGVKYVTTATDAVYVSDIFARLHFEFRNVR
jgi:hypothetical protein